MPSLLPIFVLMGASILWGTSWMPLKALHAAGASGLALIACAYGLLTLLLMPFLLRYKTAALGHLKWLAAISIFGGAANVCFSYAIIYGDVVRVMVLFYLLPAWGVLGGRFILQEPTAWWRWCGVALALAGAFIILGGPSILAQPVQYLDLIAIGAGLFFTASNLVFRGVQTLPLPPKLSALFIGSCLWAIIMLPAGPAWHPGQFPWAWVLLYAGSWLLIANIASLWAISRMSAGRSAIILIMELIAAVGTQVAFTEQTLKPLEWVGGALIFSAALIEIVAAQKAEPAENKA